MLASNPKGFLDKIKRICANFLWKGSLDYKGAHLACWDLLTQPKKFGGWGLKNLHQLRKLLEAKYFREVISKNSPWCKTIQQKYICPKSIMKWIRSPRETPFSSSNHWKALTSAFSIIGDHLAWKVSTGSQVRTGSGAYLGCSHSIFLPPEIITHLQSRGLCFSG